MIQSAALLKDLKAQLKLVQADLRSRADDTTDRWGARLQEDYAGARKRERTGHSWVVWRDNEVDQAAVAWLISMTFVRFCEDNNLLGGARLDGQSAPVGWIAGPGDRTARAEENLTAYFRENPTHNRRDWLRQGFRVLAAQPAGKALVDEKHNPVWSADISAERASALIDFWRQTGIRGELVHDFSDANLDTRFLGDLYQDLSEHARKTYALLQTPIFVEEFILDQTLTPALAEFGIDGLKLIDPTCGSGHFLLGAFARLVDQWQTEAPALDAKERVRRAMDSIHGVDLNPFAVAIARFRLTVAGLLAIGEHSLVGVPDLGFHLAIGDSLLGETGGVPQAFQFDGEEAETYFYDGEDLKKYAGILKSGQYHVVVGNPPYITVKDKALNTLYRASYKTVAGKYALSVPFMELFFRLAIRADRAQGAGHVGQITSNSFMTREFGKRLIEDFLSGNDFSNPVDLVSVIDSAGVWMRGHNFDGTPTVILIGRRRRPVSTTVRAVLGVRGDATEPADHAYGPVWREIVENMGDPGFVGKFVSITDLSRDVLKSHPWSLSGGGAPAVMEQIDNARQYHLGSLVDSIGFSVVTGDDEFLVGPRHLGRRLIGDELIGYGVGDEVRDFAARSSEVSLVPTALGGQALAPSPALVTHLWRGRRTLSDRVYFGKRPAQRGLRWFDYAIYFPKRNIDRDRVVFAFVATHNHFVRDSGGRLFKQSAPVITFPPEATDDAINGLVGVLNSSLACFWMKEVSYPKDKNAEPWATRYEFTGTKLKQFPLPASLPAARGRKLDTLARASRESAPDAVIRAWLTIGADRASLSALLADAESKSSALVGQMVFEQEELDWETYLRYGLLDADLTFAGDSLDRIELGQRAFEIVLADGDAEGPAWFARHGSTPTNSIPPAWPEDYQVLMRQRLRVINSEPAIRLLEKPDFKRRWAASSWDDQVAEALRVVILDQLDSVHLWQDAQGPAARSVADLADMLKGDNVLHQLVTVLAGGAEVDLAKVLASLVTEEAVPYLATHRYKPSGLEKFRTWQHGWDLQRREDAGEEVDIPVPPRYGDKDFAHKAFWKARGKLDVPKERFILYPDFGREGDGTVVLGWAGWDHKDQALALAREVLTQDALGADDELLTQMVAGLVELEPWVHQWHSDMDVSFGVSPADAISGIIDQQLGRLESTREEVTAWEAPAAKRGRRAKSKGRI
ncbi:BREX-2 system adenine-specific DNA-methyltransferase PglX [Pseudoclavibacter helvolus]|uniref:BREX-2 system adenine-specific DNA-methyltransferase PglX n=1 Tax=Pseudoclavibacter helvolus TaxID=255205 RepID=UPI0037362A38